MCHALARENALHLQNIVKKKKIKGKAKELKQKQVEVSQVISNAVFCAIGLSLFFWSNLNGWIESGDR